MDTQEFKTYVAEKKPFLLLDIREADELLTEAAIPGSTHLPMGKVFTSVADGTLINDKPIIVFCRSGKRAGIVAHELQALGFDAKALEGGLQALRADNN